MSALRIDNKPGADTRLAVRSVLDFMGAAFSAIYSSHDDLTPEMILGASRILDECAEALREVDDGGASA